MRALRVILTAVFISALSISCYHSKHRPIDVYLAVESEHGSPNPPVGSNYLNYGMTITASVTPPFSGLPGTCYVCTGWTGTGSVPATGDTNSCQFIITENSTITWTWKTQYYLTVVSPYGNPQGEGWYDEGTTATWSVTSPWPSIQARLETGVRYIADSVSGTVLMNAPETVTLLWSAQFLLHAVASPDYRPEFGAGGEVDFLPEGEPVYEVVQIPESTHRWGWYSPGTVVQLTATPSGGYMFTNWSGDLSGSDNPTTLTMDSPRSVTANFSVAAIYVDGASGQDTNDGLTWETAVKTIQTGLDKAANGWTVLVANGTYTGTGNKNLDFNGKAIHLVSVGGAENCIIDCQDSGRGFYFGQGEDADSVVEGFTIRNGVAGYGGAVYCCNSSSPAITNCTFSGNSASDGGAVYCWNHSSLTITNCTLSGNSAASGGAVGCWDSGPTITNCTLSGNLAGDDGGAVYCDYLSISTITNCTLSGNLAGDAGGAVYCDYSSPTITNCAFSKNSADWSGGAVYCCDSSSPTITNSTFSGNLAPQGYGGAVYCCNSSSPAITNCTFSGNSASDGGAVNCAYNCRSTITNCTLSGNLASEYGGGVCCCSYARPAITNSILWSNSATLSGNEIYIYDSPSSVMLNNSDVTPGGYGGATGNITENNCIHSDPLFLDAANSDYHLQAGSPCIDAGDNSLVPEGITTDLDGNPRIQNGTVDIGAYEYQP